MVPDSWIQRVQRVTCYEKRGHAFVGIDGKHNIYMYVIMLNLISM